uniref:Pantothenate kinase n=1 Tax=Bionectria ochroleuca TaxID=29856 RepID=A0A8H7NKB1_BIOOC
MATAAADARVPNGDTAVDQHPDKPRLTTSTDEINNTIIRPGSVKINVKGAFIVDPDTATPALSNGGRHSPTHHETSDIRLPNHTAVVSHIAIDIGGSLIKLVYFSREVDSTDAGGRLNFQNFETDRIDDCVEFMKHLRDTELMDNGSHPGELCVMATGGGAYKFYDKIREALGVDVLREEEMECLMIGLDFFITEIPREVFTYSDTDPMHFVPPREDIYPYLLVNIGSGVSMLKVTGPRSFQRVGGTSLGGGTLWGLLSLLTGARSFDDMLAQAEHGDNTNVDMLVGDIYGGDYGKIGLKSTTIASSFGKVFRMKREAEAEAEDLGPARRDFPRSQGRPAAPPLLLGLAVHPLQRPLHRPGHLPLPPVRHLQQHRPDRLPPVPDPQPLQHLLWRLLHPRPPPDHEHPQLRHQVLEQRREAGLLPPPRGLPRERRRLPQEAAQELGPQGQPREHAGDEEGGREGTSTSIIVKNYNLYSSEGASGVDPLSPPLSL